MGIDEVGIDKVGIDEVGRYRWQDALINPRRACAARVTVLGLCVCVCVCLSVCLCVCYSTSHFSRVYSCHKQY